MRYIRKTDINRIKTSYIQYIKEENNKVSKKDLNKLYKFDIELMKYLDDNKYDYEKEVGSEGDEYDETNYEYSFKYNITDNIEIIIRMYLDEYEIGHINAKIIDKKNNSIEEIYDEFESETLEKVLINNYKPHNIFKKLHESVDCNYFSNKFNIGAYDGVMEKPLYYYISKYLTGYISYMTPDEFMEKISIPEFPLEKQLKYVEGNEKHIKMLADKMKNGSKIDLPFILHTLGGNIEHEGRHRSRAAKSLGCDRIPVGIFRDLSRDEVVDFILENGNKTYDEVEQIFKDKGFNNITNLGYRELTRLYDVWKTDENKTYDDILKSDTNYSDKEKEIQQVTLDTIKDYRNIKKSLDKYFNDIEEELNNASIYKMIEGNRFLQKYVMLLIKKRESLLIEKSINEKKETIEQLGKELSTLTETEDITKTNKEIENEKEVLKSLTDRLSKYDLLDNQIKEWYKYIDDFEKKVKRGEIVIPSI